MESRKYQLKKQIIEALKTNDNDLYALLKSQWAHRFGVDSLEELNNLDFNQVNQNLDKEDTKKIDEPQDNFFKEEDITPMTQENNLIDNSEQQRTKDKEKLVEFGEISSKNFSDSKSYEIVDN